MNSVTCKVTRDVAHISSLYKHSGVISTLIQRYTTISYSSMVSLISNGCNLRVDVFILQIKIEFQKGYKVLYI
jgi:hypothetical protein